MLTDPPAPPVAVPEPIETEPVEPELEVPELNFRAPEVPGAPAKPNFLDSGPQGAGAG